MAAVEVNPSPDDASGDDRPERVGYRRSAGSPRGEARRRELLDRVTDDLATNGLVDFSLRRAARAAGTTHKVLLYHFDGADDLLKQAILQLRDRRIGRSTAAADGPTRLSLAEWVRVVWPILVGEEARVLDQAIGLAMYDPDRYAELGRGRPSNTCPPCCPSVPSTGRIGASSKSPRWCSRCSGVSWWTRGPAVIWTGSPPGSTP